MKKLEQYAIIGAVALGAAYFWNSFVYNSWKGIYDAAAQDRDKFIGNVIDTVKDPVQDAYRQADNVIDTIMYGPINTDYRPFGTYDGWTGAGVLPIRDTGTGIIPTLNRYEDSFNDINQQTGQAVQYALGEYMKFAPWNIFGTVKDGLSSGASWLGGLLFSKPEQAQTGVAPLPDGTVSIMPVNDDMLGPGGENPYNYDISKLPLDPNGQPYLPPNYGVIENRDFTSSGGQANVPTANVNPSTPAVIDPDIGTKADADPDRYIPAVNTDGHVLQNGYYDTVEGVVKTISPPVLSGDPADYTKSNTIPGFNAPMDSNAISLPKQDPSPTVYNAPRPTVKCALDANGNYQCQTI